VAMIWHLRNDSAPDHQWLRQRVIAAAAAADPPEA
jgi:hypothetical protein